MRDEASRIAANIAELPDLISLPPRIGCYRTATVVENFCRPIDRHKTKPQAAYSSQNGQQGDSNDRQHRTAAPHAPPAPR